MKEKKRQWAAVMIFHRSIIIPHTLKNTNSNKKNRFLKQMHLLLCRCKNDDIL